MLNSLFIFLGVTFSAFVSFSQKATKPPEAKLSQDGAYTRIELKDSKKGVGFLWIPKTKRSNSDVEKAGLIVLLHGHLNTPKNMMVCDLGEARGHYLLAVQGSEEEKTGPGQIGYAWNDAAKRDINDLVRFVIANYPIDPAKTALIGHSAGGTMAFSTFASDPKLYGGLITVSAPAAPWTAHREGRVCVFLGTQDPNFGYAEDTRRFLGGKNEWMNGCLFVVQDAVHNDFPGLVYLDNAIEWCWHKKCRGGEATIPRNSPDNEKTEFRFLRIGFKGEEKGQDTPRVERNKEKASSLAKEIAKVVSAGSAFFPLEAIINSDDLKSFSSGGKVSLASLAKIDASLKTAAEALTPGTISKPIETPKGVFLIYRDAK